MASSSVSQESLDREDSSIEFSARTRSRNIRALRARGALRTERDMGDLDHRDGREQNGETGDGEGGDHDSPTRAASSRDRPKDKRTRPNHLQRGKLPKDKRKLREKRRSTGVVKLPSTESTGDSLDDAEDDKEKVTMETSRNTKYNEIIDADNPQTPSEEHGRKSFATRRNKSPSDLEADLEDNQDYDSTISQSETNLTLIGQSEPVVPVIKPAPVPYSNHVSSYSYSRIGYSTEPTVNQFSTSNLRSTSDQEAKTSSSTSNSSSNSSSILSRYREVEPPVRHHHSSVFSRYPPDTRSSSSRPDHQDSYHQPAYVSRFRDRDTNQDANLLITNNRVWSARENNVQNSTTTTTNHLPAYSSRSVDVPPPIQNDVQVEKLQEENQRLQNLVEEKDKKIAELEAKLSLLNTQVQYYQEHSEELQGENSALLRALTRLTAQ